MTTAPKIKTDAKVETFAIDDLEPAPYNPREISAEALHGLQDSLSGLGLLEMPVVNVRDGKRRLVGGHQRIKALRAQGVTHVDCVVVDLDEAEEMSANLTLNNPAIRGDFDARKAIPTLGALMQNVPVPSYMGLGMLDAELRAIADRLGPVLPPSEAANATPQETPDKPNSKPGTVYHLGRHRLLCGDVKDAATLFPAGAVMDACITDPPYGVAYEQAATGETLQNDNLEGAQWRAFLQAACEAITKHVDGPCFVFMSSKEIPALARAWADADGVLVRWLFWTKDRFTLGRGDYHHMHEPCLFGTRAGVAYKLDPSVAQTNVLEFPKPQTNDLHPTQKPVELIRHLLLASTQPDDLVFDPFAGSGTTLAVCEEQGRSCYAIEIDPKHCDTIRRRWAEQVHGPNCAWQTLTAPPKKAAPKKAAKKVAKKKG